MDNIDPYVLLLTPHLQSQSRELVRTDDTVAGGSEAQDISSTGIGRKQMGQSSLAGGSLNSASSRSSAARCLQSFLCVGQ